MRRNTEDMHNAMKELGDWGSEIRKKDRNQNRSNRRILLLWMDRQKKVLTEKAKVLLWF